MKKILLIIFFLFSINISFAYIKYDGLEKEFTDAQFKKIFSHNNITTCIWVQEYRKNQVFEGKITKDEDIVMHDKCAGASRQVYDATKRSIKPILLDPSYNGKAVDFSDKLKKRYKKLFPNWKNTMQAQLNDAKKIAKTEYVCDTSTKEGLDDCVLNVGKKKEMGKDSDDLNVSKTIGNTVNSLKSITGIFGKD